MNIFFVKAENKKNILKSGFPILLLFLITLVGCENEGYDRFEAWDRDSDMVVVEDEFVTTYGDAGYYRAWDLDNDGFVDATEWETGVATYYPAYDPAVYGTYDAWNPGTDEVLDEDEFTAGTYRLWDTNNDGQIEVVEYEEWYHDI